MKGSLVSVRSCFELACQGVGAGGEGERHTCMYTRPYRVCVLSGWPLSISYCHWLVVHLARSEFSVVVFFHSGYNSSMPIVAACYSTCNWRADNYYVQCMYLRLY